MHILKALSTAYDVLMGKVSTGGGASDSYSHASMSQTMNRTMNSPMHTGKGTDTHTQANAAPNNCPSAQMDTESVAAIKARTDANFEETTGTRTQSSKDGAKGKYTSNKASSNGGAGLKVLESGRSATANTRTNEVAQLLAASAKSDTRAQVAADIVGLCDRTTRGGGTMTRSTANTDADTKQAMTGVYSHIGAGASQQSGKAADKHGGCSAAAEVGSAYMGASVAGDRKGLGRSPMRSLIVLFSHSVAQLELARVEEMDKERVRAQRMAFEAAQCVCKCVCTVCVDSGEAASGSKYVTKDCGDSGSADTINGNEANKNVGTDTDTEKRTPQEPFNMLNNVLRPRIPSRSHGNGRARGRSETDLTQLITGPVMAVHRDLRVLILADVYMLLQGLSPLTGEAASASLQLPEFRPVSNRFSTITSTASRHGINVSYERLLQDLDRTMVHILEPLCQADTLSNDTQPDAPANITGRTNDPPHSIPHTHAHASRSVSAREATIGPSDLCLGKASYCLGLYYFNQQGALDVAREWMQLSLNTFYPHSDATCDAARLPKELSVPLRDDYEGGLGYQHNHNTHAATLAENERYSAGLTTTRTGTDPPTPTRARTRQNAQHTRGLATNPSIGKKHTKGKGGKLWSGASPQTRNAIMCIAGGCEKDAEVDARSGCHGDEAKGAAESGAETSLHVGLSNAAKESTLNITCGDVRKSARCSAENQIGECAHTSVGGERGGCRACAPLTTGLLVAVPYPQLGYTALKAHGETLVALERHTEALDVMSLGRGVHAALYFSAGDVGLMRNLACLYSYQADDCNTSSSRKSLWVDRAVECYTMVLTECAKRHRTNETAQCVHELARLQSRHMRHEGEVTTLSNGLRTIDRLTRAQKQKRQTLSTTPVITIPILEPSVGSLPTGPGGCHAMPCIHENMEDTTLANVHAPLASPSTLSTDAANGRRHSVGVCSGPTADHSTCTAATSGFDSGFFGSPRTQCNVPSPSPALAWGWLTVGASAISVKLCVELAEAMMAQGSYETAAVCLETLLNGSSSACASTTRSTRASLQPSTSKSSVSGFSMGGLNIGLSTVSTTNSSHAHSNTSASPGVGANGGQMAGSNGSAGVKSVAMSYLSPTSRAKVKHTLALCFMRKRWLREAMSLLLIGSQDVYRHSNCTQCLVGERPKPMPRTVQSQRWMKSQSLLVKVFMLAGEWGRAVATCDALLSVCGAAGGMNAVRMKILKRKGTALRKWALTSGGGGCMGLADTRVTDLYDHLSVQEMLAVSAESLRTAMELYVAAGDEVRAAKCVQALTRTTLEMIFVPVVVQGCAAETVLAMCGNGSISSNLQTIRNDAEWALSELLRLTAHPIHLIGAQLSLAEYWVIHAHTMRQAKTLEQDMSRYVEAVADAQNRTLVYWNECKDLLVALVVTNKGLVPWDTRADNRSAEKVCVLAGGVSG
ncbi:hypothetical protein SARC_09667 [Sphaeroforma arctica JP610]|uniref:Uncharacterized protein n=1 Tax=Sphaeroforma arctica JP610 TaxID=667725 RepID=A0A0L0FN07_9EUKA|nr:hypothetical protein SARC_09667 [Sphaeroforma arctica JP610]KNC77886.1 hypothetical protein SARC_09667 [Sphaeroforma arctica JP610]|eukprot:XP_014151788.1 hypothetical protein SARC_09667 [Sphaeroforma arctica JP610]